MNFFSKICHRIRKQLKDYHLNEYYNDDHMISWLPCHAIDLKKEGELNAHVDSVRFSGDCVAGLSLISSSIMRLIPSNDGNSYKDNTNDRRNDDSGIEYDNPMEDNDKIGGNSFIDLFLPPRSLYVLTGKCRYNYSHELRPDSSSFISAFKEEKEIVVRRNRRLSVIFRDTKQDKL